MRTRLTALFLCLAILLGIAETASGAVTPHGQKTASGDFFGNPDIYTYKLGSLELEPCRGDTIIHYDPATDVLFYVRQNPWSRFDPLGLLGIDEFREKLITRSKSKNRPMKANVAQQINFLRNQFDSISLPGRRRELDKYVLTTDHGIVDVHHYMGGVNAMLYNPGMSADVYAEGGKFTDSGKTKRYDGRKAQEERRADPSWVNTDDVPSDHLGAMLGEQLRNDPAFVDQKTGELKNVPYDKLVNILVEGLSAKGALSKSQEEVFFKSFRIDDSGMFGGSSPLRKEFLQQPRNAPGRFKTSKVPFKKEKLRDMINQVEALTDDEKEKIRDKQ